MFSKKTLRVEIQKEDGVFFEGVNAFSFKGLPVEIGLNVVTIPAGINAKIKIYGISKSKLDMITTLKWRDAFISKKAIRVYANDGVGEFVLFEGNIMNASPIYDNAPEICIEIDAIAGAFFNMKSEVPPSSLQGIVPAPRIFEKICSDFGIRCIKNGTDAEYKQCKDPKYGQSGLANRIVAAARDYNVYAVTYNNRVEIYPKYSSKQKIWVLTPNTFIKYPSFTNIGIKVSTDNIFDIKLADKFIIKDSEVTPANDTWFVLGIKYNLSTKIGGNWIVTIEGVRATDVQRNTTIS